MHDIFMTSNIKQRTSWVFDSRGATAQNVAAKLCCAHRCLLANSPNVRKVYCPPDTLVGRQFLAIPELANIVAAVESGSCDRTG